MEALSFMKFWLTNNNTTIKPRREIRISESAVDSSTALEDPELDDLYEGDDSFFELEISLSNFKTEREEKQRLETTTYSVSNKSKVLPFVDITTKPQQSPISLLKSGQKFRAFSFKKSKSVDSEKSTTEKKIEENNRSLNVRFRTDDETTSFRKTASITRLQQTDDTMFDGSVSPVSSSSSSSSSKRFFSLIKPLYTKTTKKLSSNGVSSSITSPASSPAAREKQRSNIPSGIRSVRRQLGKSRSASAAIGGMSPANRVDESLQVQQDGIQSAILHCKKSFHGSRESSLLSRSTSESSSQEKLSTSSSEDSYLFSRIASDSMSEKSIDSLSSIKEQREKICDLV